MYYIYIFVCEPDYFEDQLIKSINIYKIKISVFLHKSLKALAIQGDSQTRSY